jgi:integrase
MHRVLRQALRQAFVRGSLVRDPAAAARPPKVERTEMRALNPEETVRLLDHFLPTRMYVPVLLAVLCGLRRGEITALRWRVVDLQAAQLFVVASTEQTRDGDREKEPKSRRSRTVALPGFVVEELTRHRTRQGEEQLRLGMRAENDGYGVAQPDRKPLPRNSLTHEFVRIRALCRDVPSIRFHDLRRTHAMHLLAEGVHPKVAQERLGHSSVGITLDLYSQVLPGMQADAAAKVDVALRRALDRRGS